MSIEEGVRDLEQRLEAAVRNKQEMEEAHRRSQIELGAARQEVQAVEHDMKKFCMKNGLDMCLKVDQRAMHKMMRDIRMGDDKFAV